MIFDDNWAKYVPIFLHVNYVLHLAQQALQPYPISFLSEQSCPSFLSVTANVSTMQSTSSVSELVKKSEQKERESKRQTERESEEGRDI